jgi:hypothetical protein
MPRINREINRGILKKSAKIAEFCPKIANFAPRQGVNREGCSFPRKAQILLALAPLR